MPGQPGQPPEVPDGVPLPQQPQRQAEEPRAEERRLGEVEPPPLLKVPGQPVHAAAGGVAAGFIVGGVIADGRLPDGHDHLHALQLRADGEVLVAGDEPLGVPVVKAVPVNVQVLAVLENGDLAVHKLEVEVVSLHRPGKELVQAAVRVAVDLPVLSRSDVVEDVLVRLKGRVRFRRGGVARLRGDEASPVRGQHLGDGLAEAPPGADGLLLHDDGVVVAAVPKAPEAHPAPGADGQKLPQEAGDLVPESLGVLPAAHHGRLHPPLPGQAGGRRPQAGEDQAHPQEEGQQGRRPLGLPPPPIALLRRGELLHGHRGGLSRAHHLLEVLRQVLVGLTLLIRAVPFCIQCPTPPLHSLAPWDSARSFPGCAGCVPSPCSRRNKRPRATPGGRSPRRGRPGRGAG